MKTDLEFFHGTYASIKRPFREWRDENPNKKILSISCVSESTAVMLIVLYEEDILKDARQLNS